MGIVRVVVFVEIIIEHPNKLKTFFFSFPDFNIQHRQVFMDFVSKSSIVKVAVDNLLLTTTQFSFLLSFEAKTKQL